MNGAQALIRTLAGCGAEVCFANPGTSEMHFVAALDAVPQMRGVLCQLGKALAEPGPHLVEALIALRAHQR